MWRNVLITVAILMALLGIVLSSIMLASLNSTFFGTYTATINGVPQTLDKPHAGIAAFEVFILLILLTYTGFAGEGVIRGWTGQPLESGRIHKLLKAGLKTIPTFFGPLFLIPMLVLGALESAAVNDEKGRPGKP